jgi:DNA mismatch repair protein MutL
VADLIAAGEVVERPASAVKELMENSIDAGAGIVTVEIKDGGMSYIRVTDNGCGIAPDDAETAFLRHATSKLRGAEGLEAVGTLGFRGEALAAIAAVSRIELLTREPGEGEGVALTLEAGAVVDTAPVGCPEGTTIIVRDLFFNTPARRKFLKTDRAEGSAVASAVLRTALSQPCVSVRYIADGKPQCHTPGDSRVDSCIYNLFGREFFSGLVDAQTEDGTVSVTGYVSKPAAARGNRSYQFFFVNGRPIRSRTLQAALEQAYANTLTSGRFPSCVLYITTRLCDVDVNVHPAKTEVKFVSDKQAFDGVYYATLGAIERLKGASDWRGDLRGGAATKDSAHRADLPSASPDDAAQASLYPSVPQTTLFTGEPSKPWRGVAGHVGVPYGGQYRVPNGVPNGIPNGATYGVPHGVPNGATYGATLGGQPTDRRRDDLQAPYPNHQNATDYRVVGEVLDSYIVVEQAGSVLFIDKHAAHERIYFDALKSAGREPMSQTLLTPLISRHGHEDMTLLLDNAALLDSLGFTVEAFGEDAVAIRRIPSEIDIDDAEPVLSEICDGLKSGSAETTQKHEGIYRSIACKAAIKAGKASGLLELELLAARVMSGEIVYCPHGRPVVFAMPKAALDREFKRT